MMKKRKISPILYLYYCLFATIALTISRDYVCVEAGPVALAYSLEWDYCLYSSLLNSVTLLVNHFKSCWAFVTRQVDLTK